MSDNPYESPLVGGVSAMSPGIQLANRSTRLVAAIIDGFVMMVIVIPLVFILVAVTRIDMSGVVGQLVGTLLGIGVFLAVNGSLLASNGQTVGKRAMGIKIARTDGEKATFDRIVGYRLLPIWIISMVPLIGGLIALINVLFIFRESRKCLHDDIADTIVILAS
jgi:uncharacterized RDD family membrane protein YckC